MGQGGFGLLELEKHLPQQGVRLGVGVVLLYARQPRSAGGVQLALGPIDPPRLKRARR